MYKEKQQANTPAAKRVSKSTRKLIKLSSKDILIGISNLYLFYKYGKNPQTEAWQIVVLIIIEVLSMAAMSSQLFHLERWKKKSIFHEYTCYIIACVSWGISFLMVMLIPLLEVLCA